jgi:hypothetical protein
VDEPQEQPQQKPKRNLTRKKTRLEAAAAKARETRWEERQQERIELGPRGRLSGEPKEKLSQAKKDLALVLATDGIPGVIEIIKRGPWAGKRAKQADGSEVELPQTDLDYRRWEYAMNFAADRGGMPRVTEMDLAATEGVPPIEVRIVGFKKPDDV